MPPRKYEVRLVVRRLEGCDPVQEGAPGEKQKLAVEVRWKGPKAALMSSLRRASVKRNFTRREELGRDGVVVWEEEFESLCTLSAYKENVFNPWEIVFTVFNVSLSPFDSLSKFFFLFRCLANVGFEIAYYSPYF